MGRLLAHRGPDDEEFYDDGHLSLVYRRLSIVDLEGGDQPIFNEDRSKFIVVNGEIYNHAELRRGLEGRHEFSTRSDSEPPLHLFEEEGAAALARLRGMFALAIWDVRERRLLLARDRLGIKPLYVCTLPGGLLFGSELKALLAHPDCPRDPDWSRLFVPGPQQQPSIPSYVSGVEHMKPGHYMVAADGKMEMHCWWRIDDYLGAAPFGSNSVAYRHEFERLIEEATAEHLLGDVPIGLHLSGGVDSSLLAAMIADKTREVACFSAIERNGWRAGDAANARRVTEQLRLPWYPVLFDQQTLLDDIHFDLRRFEQSIHMMDSPRFDLEWILKEELHRFARHQHPAMKVVLLGQGIDEFSGGYSFRVDRPHSSWEGYLKDEIDEGLRYWSGPASGLPERLWKFARAGAVPNGWSAYHRQMRAFGWQLQHFNLWHEDRSSSSQSLEARVPYLDHRIVELLASVPSHLHSYLFWNKRIVRDVLGKRLPSYNLEHPKVPFFVTGDTRSLDLTMHEMLLRCIPQFLERYLDDSTLPFAPDTLRNFAARVVNREAHFYSEGWRLMEMLAISVFARQCRVPDADEFSDVRDRRSGAPLVPEARWPEIENLFADSVGFANLPWQDSDRVVLSARTRVLAPLGLPNQYESHGPEGMCSTITTSTEWVGNFLRHLGNPATTEFTVADWAEEFDVDRITLVQVLDVLYTAGFIVRVLGEVSSPSGMKA